MRGPNSTVSSPSDDAGQASAIMGVFSKRSKPVRRSGPIGGQGQRRLSLQVIGIVIAAIAALVVLGHTQYRGLPLWSAFLWFVGAFLLMLMIVPIYFWIHGPEPRKEEGKS